MSASPSSKSSRSPASTFSRIGASVSSVSRTATCPVLPLSVDDRARERLELLAMQPAVETCAGTCSVIERNLPGALERAGCGNTHERTVHRSARERGVHHLVLTRGEQERERRGSVAQVCA